MNNTTSAVPQLKSLQPNEIMWNGWMVNGDDCVAAAQILVSLPFCSVCFFYLRPSLLSIFLFGAFFFAAAHYLSLYCSETNTLYTHTTSACLSSLLSTLARFYFFFFLLLFAVFTWIFYATVYSPLTVSRSLRSDYNEINIYSLCSWAAIVECCPCTNERTNDKKNKKRGKYTSRCHFFVAAASSFSNDVSGRCNYF